MCLDILKPKTNPCPISKELAFHLEKSSKYHLILIFGHSLKHRHIHIFPIVFLLLFVGELEISETENASVNN